MRFLHTADLHIGKRLFDVSMAGQQREILHQIAGIAIQKQCDAVLIAGDIYDKPAPTAEAMSIFDTFVSELILGGVSVYAISGNHDSGERISYLSGLLEDKGAVFQGRYEGHLFCRTLTDEYGELDLYMLPFIKPLAVRGYFPEEDIVTYEDALRLVLSDIDMGDGRRKILMSHQFVIGSTTCDSEEFAIGGLDGISADVYEGFDYVALGHIHGPQRVGKETIRYSGTPLKYSFSESSHKKSVTIVDVKERGQVSCQQVSLKPVHDMRVVKGMLSELMELPYSEDYVQLILTDEEVAPDARISLSMVFPNMLKFSVENAKTMLEWEASDAEQAQDKSPLQMMEDFYRRQNNNVEMTERQHCVLTELLEGMKGGGDR